MREQRQQLKVITLRTEARGRKVRPIIDIRITTLGKE
jgi:hypothetical protein